MNAWIFLLEGPEEPSTEIAFSSAVIHLEFLMLSLCILELCIITSYSLYIRQAV